MLTHSTLNRIPIATAAEVATRLPGTRREGDHYRTRGYCHGSGDKPSSASLVFSDPPRPGEQSLHVHCYKCSPQTPAERDAIRHALQKATGLQLCRCRACWQAHRAGQPFTATPRARAPASVTTKPVPRRHSKRDTAAYAAELWAAARPSTSGPAKQHTVGRWFAARKPPIRWPAGRPLPETVRWLARSHRIFPRGQPDSPAAGALVMAMRPLSDPAGPTRKLHMVAIDAKGRKANHWQADKRGDKHTYGQDAAAYGLLWKQRPAGEHACDLHVVEGLADGLALLTALPEDQIVAVCAGLRYSEIDPGWFASVTLWPDGDEMALETARRQAQQWANHGYTIPIKLLPKGEDPASMNWKTP